MNEKPIKIEKIEPNEPSGSIRPGFKLEKTEFGQVRQPVYLTTNSFNEGMKSLYENGAYKNVVEQ